VKFGQAEWVMGRTARTARSEEPYLRYLDDVVRYATARLGDADEAEDVAMEVFHALRKSRGLDGVQDLRLYVIGVARRKIADALRRRKRRRETPMEDLAVEFAPDADRRQLVATTLAKLGDDQRDVLILKYIHGLTTREIAEIVDRSPEAVDSLLQRARAAFANHAEGAFNPPA